MFLSTFRSPLFQGTRSLVFLSSQKLQDKLSLAIYLNLIKMEDTFRAHMQELSKQPDNETRIMGAAFAGAVYGLKEVSAAGKPAV